MPANFPPEIWLAIFNWASCPLEGFSESYVPFEDSRFRANNVERACIRRNIGLVCRQWHALSIESLYTELNVHGDANRILGGLKGDGSGGGGYGRLVRLVSLPYNMTCTPGISEIDHLRPSLEIIRSCPNISVLIRPPLLTHDVRALQFYLRSDGVIHSSDLSSLKRLEWTHYSYPAQTGGINSILRVLASSPGLQFLSIGGDIQFQGLPTVMTMPALKTLRIQRTSESGIAQFFFWKFPVLETVVLACTSPRTDFALQLYGEQLTTLELGNDMSFFFVHDVLPRSLKCCPVLQTLNYPLFLIHPPTTPVLQQENSASTTTGTNMIVTHITCIGLYPQRPTFADGCADEEEHIAAHLDWLMDKKLLPDLKRVRLYGNWAEAPINSRFKEWARSTDLEFVDRPEQGKDW